MGFKQLLNGLWCNSLRLLLFLQLLFGKHASGIKLSTLRWLVRFLSFYHVFIAKNKSNSMHCAWSCFPISILISNTFIVADGNNFLCSSNKLYCIVNCNSFAANLLIESFNLYLQAIIYISLM